MIKQQSVNSKFKLNLILKITQAINENLSVEELLQQYKQILFGELKIGKIAVYKFNSHWEKLLVSGISEDCINKIKIEKHLSNFSEITYISRELPEVFWAFDFIIPVFHKNSVLAYILIGDIDEEMEGMSPAIRHLRFIQTISNIIIVAMEKQAPIQTTFDSGSFQKGNGTCIEDSKYFDPQPKFTAPKPIHFNMRILSATLRNWWRLLRLHQLQR